MPFQVKVIVFIAASIPIAWLSRSPLRDTQTHGFYRFFAWESILALILVNLDYWFYEPFRIHQIISWLLLIVSGFLVIHGALLLHTSGKPDRKRDDPALIGIEKTTELVTKGAYRYIRHPLYSSLLFLAWGVFFKHPSLAAISLALITSFFLTETARKEEAENIRFFGDVYQNYMNRTRMFIPFLF